MGQIILVKDADFSASPKSVNISDFPVVTTALEGLYNGKGSIVNPVTNQIQELPPAFGNGVTFKKIVGSTGETPIFPFVGSNFKGNVIRCGSTAMISGLSAIMSLDLNVGVSFTFLWWRNGPSTGNNRTLLGIQGIPLQFRSNSTTGTGHLQIGATAYDIGYHGLTTSSVEAITLTITKSTIKLYRNKVEIGSVDVSGLAFPDIVENNVSIFGNWTGASGLSGHQVKQCYIHNKVLTVSEINSIHDNLSNLIT